MCGIIGSCATGLRNPVHVSGLHYLVTQYVECIDHLSRISRTGKSLNHGFLIHESMCTVAPICPCPQHSICRGTDGYGYTFCVFSSNWHGFWVLSAPFLSLASPFLSESYCLVNCYNHNFYRNIFQACGHNIMFLISICLLESQASEKFNVLIY